MREKTINEKKISIYFKGSKWGLASNAIHFLDLLSYLTGQQEITIDIKNLNNQIYKSNRKGFIEFGGRFIAKTSRGDTLDIFDNRDTEIDSIMSFETENQIIEIQY